MLEVIKGFCTHIFHYTHEFFSEVTPEDRKRYHYLIEIMNQICEKNSVLLYDNPNSKILALPVIPKKRIYFYYSAPFREVKNKLMKLTQKISIPNDEEYKILQSYTYHISRLEDNNVIRNCLTRNSNFDNIPPCLAATNDQIDESLIYLKTLNDYILRHFKNDENNPDSFYEIAKYIQKNWDALTSFTLNPQSETLKNYEVFILITDKDGTNTPPKNENAILASYDLEIKLNRCNSTFMGHLKLAPELQASLVYKADTSNNLEIKSKFSQTQTSLDLIVQRAIEAINMQNRQQQEN